MIISISGTPGTGKTEVAKALSERLDWQLVELNKLAKEKKLFAGYDKGRKCDIVDIDLVKKDIDELLKKNKNLILESHYAHDMACDIVIILRTNPGELRNRLIGRGWTKKKIDENIESEIMEVCKSEALEQGKKVYEIDTTRKTAKTVVENIINELKHLDNE